MFMRENPIKIADIPCDMSRRGQELRSNIARLQGQAKPVGFEHPGRHLAAGNMAITR